ncbi:MAG: hypothetical protein AVDCRST_MAG76-433, partial [uncultured Acidimicrobiales bacterium]
VPRRAAAAPARHGLGRSDARRPLPRPRPASSRGSGGRARASARRPQPRLHGHRADRCRLGGGHPRHLV